jgi:hypothetical protein
MKIIFIVILLVLLISSLFLVACGGEKTLEEKDFIEIADDFIGEEFPDMKDAEKTVERYTSDGTEFYELTYNKAFFADIEGETIEVPQIVVVTIDVETGEKYIAVSD